MAEPRPSGTWADLKQFAVALLLVYPFIALTAYFARGLVGARAALWMGVGLALFATVAFALVALASLLASYTEDAASWWTRRRSRGRSRRRASRAASVR